MLEPGATVLIPSGPEHDPNRMHLHIVVARKTGPPAQVLLACVCSILEGQHHDETTILTVSEHTFLRHSSYIKYRASRIESEARIERGINDGSFLLRDDCDEQLLTRIQDGFYSSIFVRPCDRTFLDESD